MKDACTAKARMPMEEALGYETNSVTEAFAA